MTVAKLTLEFRLTSLLEKYGFSAPSEMALGKTWVSYSGNEIPLFPWRRERRFTELKTLIDNNTLEGVSTLRFANIATREDSLTDLMYREFDLAEFISGAKIISVYCAITNDQVANIILRLNSGVNVSIELSTCLPKGSEAIDRHEIIASRGVASDRVVDSQVPQHSIYLFTDKGKKTFTDTDAELYGISVEETNLVRDAFEFLKNPAKTEENNERNRRMECIVNAGKESAKSGQPVRIEA